MALKTILSLYLLLKLLKLVRDNGWPVTFSIGVATFISPTDSIDEMIDAADAQLYLSKQNGKNRTWYKVVAEERKGIVFWKRHYN